MAWKTIQGRRYLYRTVREAGRVRSIYVGRGPKAEEYDRQLQERRQKQAAVRQATAEAIAAATNNVSILKSLTADIDLLMRASLVAAGYYQHARGRWRIRRFANAK